MTLTAVKGRIRRPRLAAAAEGRDRGRKRRVPSDLSVYESIAAAIFEQRLSPGTKLTEDTLGDIFGVSRTIIRNALSRLAHDKIVEIRPNRGAVVASPTAEEARDVFEARRVTEEAIVLRAAKRIGRPEIVRLQQLIEGERAAHRRGDRRVWVRLSGAFHLGLADIAGNSVLSDFLKDLVSRTSLIVALRDAPMNAACSWAEHGEILKAVAKGDVGRAVALMNRHLEGIEQRLNLVQGEPGVDLRAVFNDRGARRGPRASPQRARSLRGIAKGSQAGLPVSRVPGAKTARR